MRTWPAVRDRGQLGPAARASASAASSSRVGVDHGVEEAGVGGAVGVVHPRRRPSRCWNWRGESRSRASSDRPPRQHHADLRLDQPDAERAARADALVGAEQHQRAGRDRVARARDDDRHLATRTCGVNERAAVGHEPARGLAAPTASP